MRTSMTKTVGLAAVAALATLSGCATMGGAGTAGESARYKQADYKTPEKSEFLEETERGYYSDAQIHTARAREAKDAGNMDQARAEWATGGEMLCEFGEKFPNSFWRIALRYQGARFLLYAQRYELAATNGEKVALDPMANETSKAMGWHLAAASWQLEALNQYKAGKIDAIKLPTAEQRKGQAPNPRPPPGPWKRFVEASDQYLKVADADPDLKKPAAERNVPAGPGQLALIAAEVEYAFDNMEDARARFERIIRTWAGDPEVMENAVPLYLQTFLVLKDTAGYKDALQSTKATLAAEIQKATDPKAKDGLQKIQEKLASYQESAEFDEARALLADGKAVDAATAFEKIVEANPSSPDAGNALYNAAIAWNKAEQPDKAAADAQRVVEKYQASKSAPLAQLMLASIRSKKKDHVEAARMYSEYLERWPQGDNRCIAMQNVGYELDMAGKKADAASRYLGWASDPKCAREDPNSAAKALVRAGKLFLDAKQRARAKEAYEAATKLEGVTDTVAKSQVDDAKKQLRKL
jgi:TolA-binding protein